MAAAPQLDGLNETSDYIIVGGGTAGVVVASSLSEDTAVRVIIVEAGADHSINPLVMTPGLVAAMYGNEEYDWNFTLVRQVSNFRTTYISQLVSQHVRREVFTLTLCPIFIGYPERPLCQPRPRQDVRWEFATEFHDTRLSIHITWQPRRLGSAREPRLRLRYSDALYPQIRNNPLAAGSRPTCVKLIYYEEALIAGN